MCKMLVIIKGAGDLATGIGCRLKRAGFKVVMTEIARPTVVRHTVAFASAVYKGEICIEGITAVCCESLESIRVALDKGQIPVVIDQAGQCIQILSPDAVVDAIIAKRNIGTSQEDAPIVIGVGPGFEAGIDCHYVVETKRGHDLGRVIESGGAIPNTGVPGEIGGYTTERIIRATKEGVFRPGAHIGDEVAVGDVVAYVDEMPIYAQIAGIVRGMLIGEMKVPVGFKCGDIDPRCVKAHCFSISDKSRAIGGGVLEAIMRGVVKSE
ncbi:MAG: selenium-dependent molybdenum cofactor biosynthesis protein YqeB [Cellulosilyticaceae bacterium]